MLVVKKFGGSSVADREHIFSVAERCAAEYRDGHQVVIVLSAMGDTTDRLLGMAHEINPNPSKRELDMLLTTGEQMSVALTSMAFGVLGVPSVSLNAFQVQMHTSSVYGNARLKRIDTERIHAELENHKIVVVTGFQGINKRDDMTTLGRGGSDTTAVALAAALRADLCEIYTDVDGVYTADPRVVPNAHKITEITYDEMLEFASLGAKVLHNRSVEMAKRYNVPLIVRSSLNHHEGTIVKEKTSMEGMLVSGVASDTNAARISVLGAENVPGVAFKIFNSLYKSGVSVDIIMQSVGADERMDISFTVKRTDLQDTLDALEDIRKVVAFNEVTYDDHVAKLSIVGAGMESNPGVAAKMFGALYSTGVNILMIGTSEIRITVLVDEEDVNRATRAVHDAFEL